MMMIMAGGSQGDGTLNQQLQRLLLLPQLAG